MEVTFSEAFAAYLKAEGLTQERAAQMIDTKQAVISRIKRGTAPECPTIERLSKGLKAVIRYAPGEGWVIFNANDKE